MSHNTQLEPHLHIIFLKKNGCPVYVWSPLIMENSLPLSLIHNHTIMVDQLLFASGWNFLSTLLEEKQRYPGLGFNFSLNGMAKHRFTQCQSLKRFINFLFWGPTSQILPILGSYFSSVQSGPTLCNPMDCSMPGFPVHHQLLEPA